MLYVIKWIKLNKSNHRTHAVHESVIPPRLRAGGRKDFFTLCFFRSLSLSLSLSLLYKVHNNNKSD